MKLFVYFLLLFPCLVFAQASKEDYAVYSQYLKSYRAEKGHKMKFVVRESTDYFRKYDTTAIRDVITSLRKYLNDDVVATSDVRFMYRSFADSLKKDTSWLSLVMALDQKIKKGYVLKNNFAKSLRTVILTNSDYNTMFNNPKDLKKEWAQFHQRYSNSAVMLAFSAVVHDKRRAVFYFIKSCGSLCAEGYLIFGYKEGKTWKFIPVQPLWES